MVAACPPVSVLAHLDGQVSDARYVSYSTDMLNVKIINSYTIIIARNFRGIKFRGKKHFIGLNFVG